MKHRKTQYLRCFLFLGHTKFSVKTQIKGVCLVYKAQRDLLEDNKANTAVALRNRVQGKGEPAHLAQTINYLEALNLQIGLLTLIHMIHVMILRFKLFIFEALK